MIFCGDFVFPGKYEKSIFENLPKEFLEKPKIINFESSILELNKKKLTKGVALYSSKDSIRALKALNVICASQANNHSTDFDYNSNEYFELFRNNNIQTLGIGNDLFTASEPFIFEREQLIILSFGWKTIRCQPATINSFGINPYSYQHVEKEVLRYKGKYPFHKLILFIHWNYEFEIHPSPADREFSRFLIDIGVDGIFGHHPHVVNSYEIYKEKPIFYSLGNFYFPNVKYGNHSINFKEDSLFGISVEYTGNVEEIKIYYHTHNKAGERMRLLGIHTLENIEKIDNKYLINISDIKSRDYKDYFKKNRFHKGKFLPIYSNFRNKIQNHINDYLVQSRQIPIDVRTRFINNLRK